MTCSDFMARYSDFLDGCVDPAEADLWSSHAEVCESCARYDRVTRRGLQLVRDLPPLEVSPDFHRTLNARLGSPEPVRFEHTAPAMGVYVALLSAVAVGALALIPLVRDEVAVDDYSAAAEAVEQPAPIRAGFASAGWWHAPTAPAAAPAMYRVTSAGLPGAYSPVVVAPPAFRAGEAALTVLARVE